VVTGRFWTKLGRVTSGVWWRKGKVKLSHYLLFPPEARLSLIPLAADPARRPPAFSMTESLE